MAKISEGGKEYKARAVYTFPISRPGKENLNGRIYGLDLWEKVIKEKQCENGVGLFDHPDNDGSVEKVWCIWRNTRLTDDKSLVVSDAYLVGQRGQEVLERLEAGGKIGLSTSGFGDFLEDKKTIDPKTFILERVADYVLNPSYEVFGTQEGKIDSKKESVEMTENKVKENVVVEEKKEVQTSVSSINEKALLFNIKSMFKEACKEESLSKRIILCKNIVESFTDDMVYADGLKREILEKISVDEKEMEKRSDESDDKDAKIKELETKIKELEDKLANKDKESDADKKNSEKDKTEKEKFKKEKESLEKSLRNATELLDSMKVYGKKQEELYKEAVAEKNAMITAKEYNESLKYAQSLEEENEGLKRQVADLLEKVNRKKEDDDDYDDDDCDDCDDSDDYDDCDRDDCDRDDCDGCDKYEGCNSKRKHKNEDYSNVNVDVRKYYEDLYSMNKNVRKIKDDILKCRTIMEAERTYIRLKGLVYDNIEDMKKKVAEESIYGFKKQNVSKKSFGIREGWV